MVDTSKTGGFIATSFETSKKMRKFRDTIYFLRTVRTLRTLVDFEAKLTRCGVKNSLRTVENQ